MSLNRRLTLAPVLWCLAAVALADDYADARTQLVAAYQAQDYPAMVLAAERALLARHDYPGAMFNLALAHALNGDAEAALGNLNVLLRKGIDFGVGNMDEFADVRELEGWPAYARRIRQLYAEVGDAGVAASYDDGMFVPEGIAIDDRGTLYLGSVRKGLLLRDGDVISDRQGHWSVFGMRFHADGNLWFASAAVPQLENVGDDLGRTGLFRLDVESGEITRAAVLPPYEEQQLLGDLVVAEDTIFASDSLTGAVYRYDIAADEFSVLAARGTFGSPQGLVLDECGEHLFVADYVGGLFRISLADGSRERVAVADTVSDYGIDGLYRYGDHLIAIQNGIRPHRVVSFRLHDELPTISQHRILAANLPAFDEPTLGAVHGDDFYFVANSHWNRFDRENRLPEGLSGPVVLSIRLGGE